MRISNLKLKASYLIKKESLNQIDIPNLQSITFSLQGVKIKMDDAGNILIRRYAKTNVYIKSTASGPNEETAIGAEILKLPNNALESEKIVKVCIIEISLTYL